jgi:hypothetical protein
MTNSVIEQHKRELHIRIGRMRRRINNRLHSAEREGRRLMSWREYVIRYPSYAVLTAFGVGLAASGGIWRWATLRRLGSEMLRHTARRAGRRLWGEIEEAWKQSGAKP